MTDQIVVHCPHCDQRYQLKAPNRDTQYACKKCQGAFLIESQVPAAGDRPSAAPLDRLDISLPDEETPIVAEVSGSGSYPTAELNSPAVQHSVRPPVFSFSPADLASAFDLGGGNVSSASQQSAYGQTSGGPAFASTPMASPKPTSQALNELNLPASPKAPTKNAWPLILLGVCSVGLVAVLAVALVWIYLVPTLSPPGRKQQASPAGQVAGGGQQPTPVENAPQLQNARDFDAIREQIKNRNQASKNRRVEREKSKADQPNGFVVPDELPNLKPNQIVAEFDDLVWGVSSLAFSPSGKLYASKNDNGMLTFDVKQRRVIDEGKSESQRGKIEKIFMSPDGSTMVSTERLKGVQVWQLDGDGKPSRRETYVGHNNQISAITFNQDGSQVAMGSERGDFCVWDLEKSLEDIIVLKAERMRTLAVYVSPDNASAIVTNGEEILRFDLVAKKVISRTKVTTGYAQVAAFSPDGKTLVVACSYDLKVIDVESGTLVRTLKGPSYSIFSVAISPDGKYVVAGGTRVVQWDWQEGKLVNEYETAPFSTVKSIAFSNDGELLAIGHKSLSQSVRVFRVRNHAGDGAN